jgi:hypothetical protein
MEQRIARILNSYGLHHTELPAEARSVTDDFFGGDNVIESDTDDSDIDINTEVATGVPVSVLQTEAPDVESDDATQPLYDRPIVKSAGYTLVPDDHVSVDELQRKVESAVDHFFQTGCGCAQSCQKMFDKDIILQSRLECQAMDYYDSTILIIFIFCLWVS